MDELIANMEKYRQRCFTKITSLLLDFPLEQRNEIGRKIKQKLKKIERDRMPDGFVAALGDPYDFGFSYYTSTQMTSFYNGAKKRTELRKYQQKISRFGAIGRNTSDKKNFATFFFYLDYPWEYDSQMENEIQALST